MYQTMYQWSESDFVCAFRLKDGVIDDESVANGSVPSKGSPGGSISISADGSKPAVGIVWGTIPDGASVDQAISSAQSMPKRGNTRAALELAQNVKRDPSGTLMKFVRSHRGER